MAVPNRKRMLLSALAGFAVWAIWSGILNFVVLAPRYQVEQDAGHLLKQHPYAIFRWSWLLTLLVFSLIATQFYVWARASLGPALRHATTVGLLVGFTAAQPIEIITSRIPLDHAFTICWIVDLVAGAALATTVAGRLYTD